VPESDKPLGQLQVVALTAKVKKARTRCLNQVEAEMTAGNDFAAYAEEIFGNKLEGNWAELAKQVTDASATTKARVEAIWEEATQQIEGLTAAEITEKLRAVGKKAKDELAPLKNLQRIFARRSPSTRTSCRRKTRSV